MKLVIEISKSDYEYIKKLDRIGVGECLIDNVYEGIRKGIVLPEGHGRLIDVSKLRQDIFDDKCWWYATMESPNEGYSLKTIREAETIIEADGGGEDA